jgi:hypothetical protein
MVYTYSECVVTVNSSRRAALEARSTRGGTRVCRASGVFTENVAPVKLSVESTPDWTAPVMVERQSPESLDWGEMLRINELQNLFWEISPAQALVIDTGANHVPVSFQAGPSSHI